MSEIAIDVRGISKRYRLGVVGAASLWDDVETVWRRLKRSIWGSNGNCARATEEMRLPACELSDENEFWALRDVSFSVETGEIVGIIGRNGAGKSTLLKLLSRITEPSSGEAIIRGRVASLLEVGTGFHPDLSGRENIFLNGAILGMTMREIRSRFDEIVAFAEIERFVDTPVKRYSSGMYVRLAFAVAAHLEPDILIIDEVLAVGDQQFQRKCLGKMKDVSRKEGRTVLLVSHTMPVILQLARRCLVLESGKLRFHGQPEQAIEYYLNGVATGGGVSFDVANSTKRLPGIPGAMIVALRFPRALPIFESHEDIVFVVTVHASQTITSARVSITVFTNDGTPVGSCFSPDSISLDQECKTEVEVRLPCPALAPGAYFCAVAIGKGSHKTGHVDFDVVLETLQFEVCAAPGKDTKISHWCQQWGRIVFNDLSVSRGQSFGPSVSA
jgi:lipopolysaccharide transport system ATP-binding protein